MAVHGPAYQTLPRAIVDSSCESVAAVLEVHDQIPAMGARSLQVLETLLTGIDQQSVDLFRNIQSFYLERTLDPEKLKTHQRYSVEIFLLSLARSPETLSAYLLMNDPTTPVDAKKLAPAVNDILSKHRYVPGEQIPASNVVRYYLESGFFRPR